MKVYAPGKLILSGEHAVVYGAPALAMAVNRYVMAEALPQTLPLVSFDLSDLGIEQGVSLAGLHRLQSRIRLQYKKFISGECGIREVLRKSHELAQFAFGIFFEAIKPSLRHGVRIRLQSDIPVGCGMGSSAATILGVAYALVNYLKLNVEPDFFLHLGLEAENMQHGFSSGLDLRVCLQGGCLFMHNSAFQPRAVPQFPLYLVNTGMPEDSTGECVSAVAKHFADQALIDAFSEVTIALDGALIENNWHGCVAAVRANHQLLTKIGVVPQKILQFITEIEASAAAAKICGAGAVRGEHAGIVMVLTHDVEALTEIAARYHYALLPIVGEAQGVHVAA